MINPTLYGGVAIYGYPGKKSGLEVQGLNKIKINESYQEYFRILMLHTTITEVKGNLPIESIDLDKLPKADYYALGHIHIDFEKEVNNKPVVYGGPTFPNNFKELEELKQGGFYIIDVAGYTKITKKEIKLKEIESIIIKLEDALTGTQKILKELEKRDLKDKIVLLRVSGDLKKGKVSDIKFQEIQDYLEKTGVYCFLKNTSKLEAEKQEIKIKLQAKEMEKVEEVLVEKYEKENPSDLNELIFPLMEVLNKEKQEGEKNIIFETRLFSELSKVLKIEL